MITTRIKKERESMRWITLNKDLKNSGIFLKRAEQRYYPHRLAYPKELTAVLRVLGGKKLPLYQESD
ncbi:hypothetical protein D3C87_1518010 [compost metagenome]